MGMQYDAGRHCFENRRESVILYDGDWYKHCDNHDKCHIFGTTVAQMQDVEVTKEWLGFVLAFFDNPEMREKFGLEEHIKFAKSEIDSEVGLDEAMQR